VAQVKPTPDSSLHFAAGDVIVGFAERHRQLTLGAHLVWDEGFGAGWSDADLYGIPRAEAENLLYGVIGQELRHYRGRMDAWIVANEVTGPAERDRHGFRTDVPWYQTIGSSYVGECFHLAADEDPKALRIINEFGFETTTSTATAPSPGGARSWTQSTGC
jgi:endo-1,4-beta-xylanase